MNLQRRILFSSAFPSLLLLGGYGAMASGALPAVSFWGAAAAIAVTALALVAVRQQLRQLSLTVAQAAIEAGAVPSEHDHGLRRMLGDDWRRLIPALDRARYARASADQQIRHGAAGIDSSLQELVQLRTPIVDSARYFAKGTRSTVSATSQLLASVEKSAEGSKELSSLAASASAVAAEGGDLVRQVVLTMESIRQASKRIVDIIGVIDDIAYQTNILALNAAVEAARAGAHGRGFAVVAGEVQTLSRRSASAAKEIQQLIKRSVQQVGLGATLTDAAGSAMDDIVARIARVNDIMRGLDLATQQEAAWFDEIVASITKLDQAAASNVGLVQSLTVQTQQMREQVRDFLHGGRP